MSRPPVLDDLDRFVDPVSPVLTPDADRVIYALTSTASDGSPVSELWIRAASPDAGEAHRLTTGARDASPVVSPDGRHVAFVRTVDDVPSVAVLSLVDDERPEPTILTTDLPVTGRPAFSPNSRYIAFAALVDDHASDPPAPLVIDGVPGHKVDGAGWIGTARTQLHCVPVTGGDAVRLTDDGHCSDPAWSPSGDRIAFTHQTTGGDAGIRQRIGIVDVERPRESVVFPFAAEAAAGPLTWTPEGDAIVAIGAEKPAVALNRLLRLELATGTTTVLTADLDRNVMGGAPGYPGGAPAFDARGRLVFCIRDGGQTVVCSQADGALHRHDLGPGTVVSGLDVVGTRAVARVSDPTTVGELVVIDLTTDAVTRLTDYGAASLPDVAFIPTRPVDFTISDGTTVHGWLLRAPETVGPAPTLLDIHGGPHNAWTGVADSAHLYHQLLAAQGWNILTLNPRASDGYGEEFYQATMGAWGESDQNDFLEPLDRLISDGLADPDRLAVTGYSYGGFMTCWLTSHTDRFRSAVPGGLVCDNEAMNASSDMGAYLHDLEIGGPDNTRRLSPLTYVDQVTTPSLILHGQDDQRCPLAQAELWYTRLRGRGTPTEMVVYPGGSHTFFLDGPLSHRRDFNARIVDWVTRHDQ